MRSLMAPNKSVGGTAAADSVEREPLAAAVRPLLGGFSAESLDCAGEVRPEVVSAPRAGAVGAVGAVGGGA